VKANQAHFAVRRLFRVLRVSASGYYGWLDRAPSARPQANAALMQRISEVHQASDATYGAPRICAELAELGVAACHNRIARLMRLHGLRGVSRRRAWCVTTRREKDRQPAPDLVQRRFKATDVNQLWVADMTYIPTWAGFGYLAVVLDVFSRKIVGWAFGQRMTADLVLAALNLALLTRKPSGVIHHSDQGSQYTSVEFGRRCAQMGRTALDGQRGRRLRQRYGRERLRQPRVRADRSQGLEILSGRDWRPSRGSRVGTTRAAGIAAGGRSRQ
jgi:putative transposase